MFWPRCAWQAKIDATATARRRPAKRRRRQDSNLCGRAREISDRVKVYLQCSPKFTRALIYPDPVQNTHHRTVKKISRKVVAPSHSPLPPPSLPSLAMSVYGGQEFEDFAFKRAMWPLPGEKFGLTRNIPTALSGLSAVRGSGQPDGGHICAGSGLVGRSQSSRQSRLQQILPTTLSITEETTPRQIFNAVVNRHRLAMKAP